MKEKKAVKYIVVGSGKLAVRIAEYLKQLGLNPYVYEKHIASFSGVEKLCAKKEISYRNMTSSEMTEQLMTDLENYELKVFSCINTYIFPEKILKCKNFWGINYHNALLPYHKGMNAEAWAIYNMDNVTGITWHRIRPSVDAGEILIQKKIRLDSNINSLKLLKMQSDLAYEAFLEISPVIFSGSSADRETFQPVIKTTMHRIKDVPNNGVLSKKWNFQQTSAFLRALDYGKLNTLGKPCIKFHSDIYEWERYKLMESTAAETDSVEIEESNMIIAKKGDRNRIVLVNIKRRDFNNERVYL